MEDPSVTSIIYHLLQYRTEYPKYNCAIVPEQLVRLAVI